jgi:hypothetical protein
MLSAASVRKWTTQQTIQETLAPLWRQSRRLDIAASDTMPAIALVRQGMVWVNHLGDPTTMDDVADAIGLHVDDEAFVVNVDGNTDEPAQRTRPLARMLVAAVESAIERQRVDLLPRTAMWVEYMGSLPGRINRDTTVLLQSWLLSSPVSTDDRGVTIDEFLPPVVATLAHLTSAVFPRQANARVAVALQVGRRQRLDLQQCHLADVALLANWSLDDLSLIHSNSIEDTTGTPLVTPALRAYRWLLSTHPGSPENLDALMLVAAALQDHVCSVNSVAWTVCNFALRLGAQIQEASA